MLTRSAESSWYWVRWPGCWPEFFELVVGWFQDYIKRRRNLIYRFFDGFKTDVRKRNNVTGFDGNSILPPFISCGGLLGKYIYHGYRVQGSTGTCIRNGTLQVCDLQVKKSIKILVRNSATP